MSYSEIVVNEEYKGFIYSKTRKRTGDYVTSARDRSWCWFLNPYFSQDLPLSNMVRKTNFLSISELVSEIVTFLTKKKSYQ